MPSLRARRQTLKSPYFENLSDSGDGNTSSSDLFMPSPKMKSKSYQGTAKSRKGYKRERQSFVPNPSNSRNFSRSRRKDQVETKRNLKSLKSSGNSSPEIKNNKTRPKIKKVTLLTDGVLCGSFDSKDEATTPEETASNARRKVKLEPKSSASVTKNYKSKSTKNNNGTLKPQLDDPKCLDGSESSESEDWEDVSNPKSDNESKAAPSTNKEIEFLSQLLQKPENDAAQAEDGGDLTVSVSTLPNSKSASRDPKVLAALALNRRIREHALALHTFYVLEFLTFGRFANKACDDSNIRALALSLIEPPASWDLESLRSFILYFTSLVRISSGFKNPNIADAIQSRLETGNVSRDDCTILMIAALRACGLDTRLVLAFAPPPLKPSETVRTLKPLSKSPNLKILSSDSENDNRLSSVDYIFFGEVYLPSVQLWCSIDLSPPVGRASTEFSHHIHHFPYSVGFHSTERSYLGRSPIDLASRYDPSWMSISRRLRVSDSLWKKFLCTMRKHCDDDVVQLRERDPVGGVEEKRDMDDVERIFHHLHSLPLPSKVQDYKGHPLYALRRHLLKFEVIHPPDAPTVGFLKLGSKSGESTELVYPRECVHLCHTRESWLKEAKVVRIGEKPAKVVKALMSMKRKLLQEADAPAPTVELFGPWQVEDYVPPVAENGIVPRNEHGNVELFKPCMLPIGCTHMKLPGIQHIAKRLEIDAAPAMIGWSFHKAGWAHPEYDGIVVCREVVPALVDAWRAACMSAAAAAAADKTDRALTNWKRITRHLLLWQRIEAGFQLAKAKVNHAPQPTVPGEVKRAASKSSKNDASPWEPLATSKPIFPRPLDSSDLVTKAEPSPKRKARGPTKKKSPKRKRARKRNRPSSSEDDDIIEEANSQDSD